MYTILGAGGAIADALLPALVPSGEPIRLVSRHPQPMPGASETVAADLTKADDAVRAMAGSRIAFLTVGLPYDLRVWREQWPRIMGNAIAAAQRSGTRLAFFDNVYMYGRAAGPMTESTPFNPVSRKGEIRARITTTLMEAMARGDVTAMVARAADFYGPGARTGVGNVMVVDPLAAGKAATWLADDQVPHAFTYVPDAARALVRLAGHEDAWGQTWHLPTSGSPPTGREFVEQVAAALGVAPRHRVAGRWMIRAGGLFDRTIRELGEMLYQYEAPYLFDSSKFERTFDVTPTPYAEGIRATALAARG